MALIDAAGSNLAWRCSSFCYSVGSTEQISAWLRHEHPGRPEWQVCHETIYQAIYHGGLSRQLTKRLRTGRPLHKRRRRPTQRRPRFAAPAALIDERPTIVEQRLWIGDWEGDLITGRYNRSAIGTLVDRRSRVVKLVHLPNGHSAEDLRAALAKLVQSEIPNRARSTLTWDQGPGMACHDEIAHLFSDGVFFTYPGRPCERGSNENTNGLLRQYFPKRTDLSRYTAADLKAVEDASTTAPARPCTGEHQARSTPPHYSPDHQSVATTDRIHPRTQAVPGGQNSAGVDTADGNKSVNSVSSIDIR